MTHRIGALSLLLLAITAHAQTPADARQCTRIPDSTARLACFDAAFATPAAGPSPSADTGPMALTAPLKPADPVAAFGDRGQLPEHKVQAAQLPKRLNYHVKKAEPLAGGLFRLTMDNGQVWVTKEADLGLDFASGDEVTIQRMALGGYRISHAGQGRNVGVNRIL